MIKVDKFSQDVMKIAMRGKMSINRPPEIKKLPGDCFSSQQQRCWSAVGRAWHCGL